MKCIHTCLSVFLPPYFETDLSDDEDEVAQNLNWAKKKVELNAASKALLLKWVRLGRTQIQKRGGPRVKKDKQANIDAVRKQRKKPGAAGGRAGAKKAKAGAPGGGGEKKKARRR
jgi:hypothetical protein